ncbi:hypothetical protein BKA81DRAFT_412447 [Phyllosticta paracitricarpa]
MWVVSAGSGSWRFSFNRETSWHAYANPKQTHRDPTPSGRTLLPPSPLVKNTRDRDASKSKRARGSPVRRRATRDAACSSARHGSLPTSLAIGSEARGTRLSTYGPSASNGKSRSKRSRLMLRDAKSRLINTPGPYRLPDGTKQTHLPANFPGHPAVQQAILAVYVCLQAPVLMPSHAGH